jgi:radical SAM superfamily enzyme YgiQ (UPF0313 family)
MAKNLSPETQTSFNRILTKELVHSPVLGPLGLTNSNKTKVVIASPDSPRSIERGVGLQIIANAVSRLDGVESDIACTPYPNVIKTINGGEPLISLYGLRPVKEADILGLSISNPMLFYDTFRFLDLAGIPPLTKDREKDSRLIIAGGLGITNPAPLEDFVDAFVMGEGDEAIIEITRNYQSWRSSSSPKTDLLKRLSNIPGVYVPSQYTRIGGGSEIEDIVPINGGPRSVDFQVMSDIDKFRRTSLISSKRHAFLFLDFSCKYKCTFCQMSNVRGSYFSRSLDSIIEDLEELDASGVETVTLASNTSTNFPEESLLEIFTRAQGMNIKPIIRSVRIDRLSEQLLPFFTQDYLHIAPETGTDRLRNNVLRKGMKNEEIYSNVEKAVNLGVNDVRMYAIVGIPSETEHDREELARLISRVGRIVGNTHPRGNVRVDMYPLLPQVGTPFEQSDLIGIERFRNYFTRIRDTARSDMPANVDLEINPLDPVPHLVEGIANLGDRETGHLLHRAYLDEKSGKSTLQALKDQLDHASIEYEITIRSPRYHCPPWKIVRTKNQEKLNRVKTRLNLIAS